MPPGLIGHTTRATSCRRTSDTRKSSLRCSRNGLLFRQTARKICTAEVAAILIDIAERMAASIEISLARRSPPSGGI